MELAKQNTVKRNLQLNLAIAFLALLPPIQLDSICVPATVPLRPHPPPHLFFSHLCVSATTPATTTFAAPTHPCSCDRLYVCLSGNANGNILASTSLFATDSNITSFSLLFFFCCQLFVLNLIAMKMFTALLQKPTRQNAPPTVVGVTYCTRIYEYLCVWVARDGVAD